MVSFFSQKPDGSSVEHLPDGSMMSHVTVNGMTISRRFKASPEGARGVDHRALRRSGGRLGARTSSLNTPCRMAYDPELGMKVEVEGYGSADPWRGVEATSQEEFDRIRAKRFAEDNRRR